MLKQLPSLGGGTWSISVRGRTRVAAWLSSGFGQPDAGRLAFFCAERLNHPPDGLTRTSKTVR